MRGKEEEKGEEERSHSVGGVMTHYNNSDWSRHSL